MHKIILITLFLLSSIHVFSEEPPNQGESLFNDFSFDTEQEVLGLGLLGIGFILQISGGILGLEANRVFSLASHAKDKATGEDKTHYEEIYQSQNTNYEILKYTSWGLLGAGTAGVFTGVFFIIKDALKTDAHKKINITDINMRKNEILILPRYNTFLFIESNIIGIRI